jgi:sensor histidine kinase YesM
VEENYLEAILKTSLEVLTYCAIVYINLFVIIANTLEKRKNFLFLICVMIVVLVYVLFIKTTGLEKELYELGEWRNTLSMILNTSLFILISTLYWHFKKGQVERERNLQLKSEKLEAELRFLRAQISPHFLFNSLNNIYSLALQKHDDTAPMVAKLSELLRHILYEGEGGRVRLSSELDMLQQYTALHLLRKPKSKNIDFYIEGKAEGWVIAPNLLITLVENAFKHSNIHEDENAWIKMDTDMDADTGWFTFRTQNSIGSTSIKGGIGIQNVQQQLELMYKGGYHLNFKDENEIYEVELQILLKKHD